MKRGEREKYIYEELMKEGGDPIETFKWAKYEFLDRLKVFKEVNKPLAGLFMGLGYDETHTAKKKHYRRYFKEELEYV